MCTPPFTGVRIGSHLNRNVFMHEQTTIGIHEEEVPKLVYILFWCKPVKNALIIIIRPRPVDSYTVCLYRKGQ